MKGALNENIKVLRLARGMNQVEFAKRLNVTKQCVSNWENENILPSIEMLIRLSKVFNVTTDYLLGLNDVPRLDITGLPTSFIAHLSLLIEDYRQK